MTFVLPPPPQPRLRVAGTAGPDTWFPVRRIYCVGRNFADHAREMGAAVPEGADRGTPVFFLKPADALVPDGGDVPYPPGTRELHHEGERSDGVPSAAALGPAHLEDRRGIDFAYRVGLDLTRRDLQAVAKAKGLPWDIGKSFDFAAPASTLLRAADVGALSDRTLSLEVDGTTRQSSTLDHMVWSVPEILHELSKLYALRAGDLVFMGTPAGVGPLLPGNTFRATLDDLLELQGTITG